MEIDDLGDSFEWLDNLMLNASLVGQALLREEVSSSRSLEELGSSALECLISQIGLRINRSFQDALATRFRWVNGRGSTLKDAAVVANVTRERIRQIQLKFEGQSLEPPIDSALCRQVIEFCATAGDEDTFMSALRSRDIISQTSEWSTDAIGELIGIVSGPEIQTQFEAFARHNKPYIADGETKNVIRKLRNKLGLIEIGVLAREANLTLAQAFEAVRQTYASTVETSSLVLAVQHPPGSFVRTIGIQLLIKDGLTPEEVLEGINRQVDYRQDARVGSRQSLLEMIEKVAGNPCELANLPPGTMSEVELSESQIWLREIFHNSTTGLLHREQIAEAAIEDGQSLGSAGAYTSYSPILRKVALGVYCLVGTKTSTGEAETFRSGALANSTSASIDFSLINSNLLRVIIHPNYGTFEGGSFYTTTEICDLISDFEFRCECSCGNLWSEVRVRLTNSKFLIGFSPILTHARTAHGKRVGDEILIDLDYSQLTASLQSGEKGPANIDLESLLGNF